MLSGVVAFLLLLIVLLAIPITVTFKVSWQQVFQGYIKLQWAFGLVRIRIPLAQSKATPPETEELAQKASRNERSPHKKTKPFSVIRKKAFRRRIIRFISDFWHAVHKRNIRMRIRIGLGDPADTGQLWAFVGPVSGMLANMQEGTIIFEPEFLDSTFELDSSGDIRIIPLQLIYLTIGLLLSPPVWRGIKQMRLTE